MSERSPKRQSASVEVRTHPDSWSTRSLRFLSMADELKKLPELRASGVLTEAEFEEQKAKRLESD